MDTSQIISVAIFVVAMIAIMTEKVHRALVAITGAMLLLILHIMPFETAIGHIDFNTLGVLFGMMLFVAVVKQSGVFEFLAIKCARVAKGNPWTIMVLFVLLTAMLSAFLDNVTTVLLIGPMTITVCRLLDIDPVPFFMTQILASNIGGTATLIGDPPNIMIGSAAGYTFADFIAYDAPAVIIILAAVIGLFYVMYGRKISANEEHRKAIMELDENDYIKDRRLLHISVAMVVLVVVGFMTHGALGLESCVIALAAAGLILLISGESIEEALHGVEWTTLCFFAGLFIIVGAMSETGVIGMLAQGLIDVTGGNLMITMLAVLFGSAVISSFLDNTPTYLVFLTTAGALGFTEGMPTILGTVPVAMLEAISCGAVFMGANTYIGNAPNFMVKSISDENGIRMPSFFGYLLWSITFLIPVFLLDMLVFFL